MWVGDWERRGNPWGEGCCYGLYISGALVEAGRSFLGGTIRWPNACTCVYVLAESSGRNSAATGGSIGLTVDLLTSIYHCQRYICFISLSPMRLPMVPSCILVGRTH